MTYRGYFSNRPFAMEPTDLALKWTIPLEFQSEAEAIDLCRDFLKGGKIFPVALDCPDGTRLSPQELKDRSFPPTAWELSSRKLKNTNK